MAFIRYVTREKLRIESTTAARPGIIAACDYLFSSGGFTLRNTAKTHRS
jgi:hypothetical protein